MAILLSKKLTYLINPERTLTNVSVLTKRNPMIRFIFSLLVGAVVGIGIGLYLGWVQFPAEYVNSPASVLGQRYKDDYTVMIAGGFLNDNDALGAIERLRVLGVENVPEYVQQVTERFITNSRDLRDIQYMIALSEGLGRTSPIYDQFRAVDLPVPESGQ